MKRFLFLALLAACVAVPAQAEVIQFKNGDQLTGSWVRVLYAELKFKSETLGEVSIPISKLKLFSVPKNAVVVLKNSQTVRGHLTLLTSGEWQVVSKSGIKVLRADAVEAIFPQEVYEPRSLERTVMPWQNWHGSSNLGATLVRGDLTATTVSLGVNATHKSPDLPGLTERWRTNFVLSGLYSTTQSSPQNKASADSISSGVRQDILFTSSDFVFALAQLDHVQAQNLDLRQTYGAGFGRDIKRSARTQISLLGGATLVSEQFSGGTRRQNPEGLVGEKIGLGLTGRVRLQHSFSFYPSLTSQGQNRFETVTTVSTRLFARLSLDTSLADRFLSQPPIATIQKNEVTFTTGLGFHF
jgi:hypothetical protein